MEGFQQTWDDLGGPNETKFYKALARKGIDATYKQVRDFIQTKSERQVIAPGPKYTGHIVAFDIEWRTSLASRRGQPPGSTNLLGSNDSGKKRTRHTPTFC